MQGLYREWFLEEVDIIIFIILKNNASLISFYGTWNYKCDTTGLIWSNLDQISSKLVRWYQFVFAEADPNF